MQDMRKLFISNNTYMTCFLVASALSFTPYSSDIGIFPHWEPALILR